MEDDQVHSVKTQNFCEQNGAGVKGLSRVCPTTGGPLMMSCPSCREELAILSIAITTGSSEKMSSLCFDGSNKLESFLQLVHLDTVPGTHSDLSGLVL